MRKSISFGLLTALACTAAVAVATGYDFTNLVDPAVGGVVFAMTALAVDRDTKQVDGVNFEYPQAAVKIFDGAIVAMNSSGYATKGAASTTLKALGVAAAYSDNSGGSAGDLKVKVKKGVFRFGNSASSDAITLAEVGSNCYIVDDQTVAKTDGSSARSVAGVVVDVDSVGVWVKFA